MHTQLLAHTFTGIHRPYSHIQSVYHLGSLLRIIQMMFTEVDGTDSIKTHIIKSYSQSLNTTTISAGCFSSLPYTMTSCHPNLSSIWCELVWGRQTPPTTLPRLIQPSAPSLEQQQQCGRKDRGTEWETMRKVDIEREWVTTGGVGVSEINVPTVDLNLFEYCL